MAVNVPTVLILGAGASTHCNYPLGINLISDYARLKNKDDLNQLPAGWDKSHAVELINKLTRSGYYSIDAALEKIEGVLKILCHSFIINFTGVTNEQEYTAI